MRATAARSEAALSKLQGWWFRSAMGHSIILTRRFPNKPTQRHASMFVACVQLANLELCMHAVAHVVDCLTPFLGVRVCRASRRSLGNLRQECFAFEGLASLTLRHVHTCQTRTCARAHSGPPAHARHAKTSRRQDTWCTHTHPCTCKPASMHTFTRTHVTCTHTHTMQVQQLFGFQRRCVMVVMCLRALVCSSRI